MSRVLLLSPSVPIIDEVLGHLMSEGGDYSGNIIVFPGKRPAHFLRKAIAEREKRAFLPPRVFAMDAFIEFLSAHTTGSPPDLLAPIDAAAPSRKTPMPSVTQLKQL